MHPIANKTPVLREKRTLVPTYDGRIDPADRVRIYLKNNKRHVTRKIFIFIVCFMGCCFQMYTISSQFMEYTVISDLEISRPELFIPPRLAVCAMVKDLQRMNGQGPIGDWDGMSVNDLMKLSPIITNDTAKFNLDSGSLVVDFNWNNGTKSKTPQLTTIRFFKREQMCFSVFPTNNMNNFSRSYGSIQGRDLYGITIHNYWLNYTNMLYIFLYDPRNKFTDKSDTHLIVPLNKVKKTQSKETGKNGTIYSYYTKGPNRVNVGYIQHNTHLLPPPYPSKCLEYRKMEKGTFMGRSQSHCFDLCALNKLNGPESVLNGRYDPVELYSEGSNNKLITQKMMNTHPGWKEKIEQVEKECRNKCYKPDCLVQQFVPKLDSLIRDKKGRIINILVQVPSASRIVVNVKGLMFLIDYVTYGLCCSSFWLGLAPYAFMTDYKLIQWAGDFIYIHLLGEGKGKKGYGTVVIKSSNKTTRPKEMPGIFILGKEMSAMKHKERSESTRKPGFTENHPIGQSVYNQTNPNSLGSTYNHRFG